MKRCRDASIVIMITVGLVLTFAVGSAWAVWTVHSVAGGNGASAAASLDRDMPPTAAADGTNVTVNWSASTVTSGQSVTGYIIKRYDAQTLTSQTLLTACDGVIARTSCIENDVPAGQWVYSVTPTMGTSWVGPESLTSNIVAVDSTPPANSISSTTVTGNAFKSGDTVYYRGIADGSFTLTNAVSDTGSGPASSSTTGLQGNSTGWTHSPSTVSSPSGGPYVSNPFSWSAGTTTSPTEDVIGRDSAGNTATTTLAFANDSTAPAAGTISYADGYQPDQSVTVTFTSGTDAGSGIATRQLQRASAALTAGVCGAFSSFANLGSDSPASPYLDTEVTDGTCYVYRFVVTDRVGNQDTATSPHVARVDRTGGGPALRSAATYSVFGGTAVVNTGPTSLSGDLGTVPIGAITGFPPGTVAGTIHSGDLAAGQALSDLTLAYNDAAGRTPTGSFSGDLIGRTFPAGVYHTDAAMALTGTMTLDGQGNPNSVFIFQVNAALNTAASSNVRLINGAQADHVFWQVNGAAGTGALSSLPGTIMAAGAITLGEGSQLFGRALSYTAVTLASNTVTTN